MATRYTRVLQDQNDIKGCRVGLGVIIHENVGRPAKTHAHAVDTRRELASGGWWL